MSEQTYNMNDVDSGGGGFDVIPTGRYPMRCTGAEMKVSSNGNDMIEATFTITGDSYANRKLWDRFMWSDAAMWKVKSALEAAQSDLTTEGNLTKLAFMDELNEGMSFQAYVDVESYTTRSGDVKSKNIMKNFTPLNEDQVEAPSEDSVFA